MNKTIYDVIGVGFGPANLALAVAMEESTFDGKVLFFERKPGSFWQEQMLLNSSDIQNNPSRDLVTPRNPRSRYTFINFLFENDRLYEHLNLGIEFPLRREYAEYVQWVAGFFNHLVNYSCNVSDIKYIKTSEVFEVTLDDGRHYLTRSVVVAPGRTPRVPSQFQGLNRDNIFHLTEYQKKYSELSSKRDIKKVVVIGGSQSSIEIMLDIHANCPNTEIHNIQRGYGFRLKDTSQFSEHVYFPSFVDYYYNCSTEGKARINNHLHFTNYSAADGDVIKELYLKLYEDKLENTKRVYIHGFHEVQSATEMNGYMNLSLSELNTGVRKEIEQADCVILATGFRDLGSAENSERFPGIIESLYPNLKTDSQGVIEIGRDYSLSPAENSSMGALYLNGLCESSHGYGDAGSFSLLALRSRDILQSLEARLSKSSQQSNYELDSLQ